MKPSDDLKYLLYSLVLHTTLFLVFAVKIFLFPSERVDYIRSVRVDFISLPDKEPTEGPQGNAPVTEKTPETEKPMAQDKPKPTAEPQKAENPHPALVEKPSKKDKSKESIVKEKQSAALTRIEALEKIKKLKEQRASTTEGTVYKGNVLSQGASLTGVDKLQHDQYLEKLDQQIKNNWHLPEWLANKNYTAAIVVKFDEAGAILDKKLTRSSGNNSFDTQALDAVAQSAPFPPPPESLVSYFKVRGIELRFPQ